MQTQLFIALVYHKTSSTATSAEDNSLHLSPIMKWSCRKPKHFKKELKWKELTEIFLSCHSFAIYEPFQDLIFYRSFHFSPRFLLLLGQGEANIPFVSRINILLIVLVMPVTTYFYFHWFCKYFWSLIFFFYYFTSVKDLPKMENKPINQPKKNLKQTSKAIAFTRMKYLTWKCLRIFFSMGSFVKNTSIQSNLCSPF